MSEGQPTFRVSHTFVVPDRVVEGPSESILVRNGMPLGGTMNLSNTMRPTIESTMTAPLNSVTTGSAHSQTLTHDPNTGLEIIGIPSEFEQHFTDLKDSVLHWFGVVQKVNRHWKTQQRVCILSDNALYICMNYGDINRCVLVESMKELLLTPPYGLGIRIDAPDYDLMLVMNNLRDRDTIVNMLERIMRNLTGRPIAVRKFEGDASKHLEHLLVLQKPSNWVLKLEPIKKKHVLQKMILDQRKRAEKDRLTFEREKENLTAASIQLRGNDNDRFHVKLAQYETILKQKNEQIETLEHELNLCAARELALRSSPSSFLKPTVASSFACTNCCALKHALERTATEDKRYILHLEDQLEQQRKVIEHFKHAHRRQGNILGASTGSTECDLQQELFQARTKIAELQRVIILNVPPTSNLVAEVELSNGLAQSAQTGALTKQRLDAEISKLRVKLVEKDNELAQLRESLRESYSHQINLGAVTMNNKLQAYTERMNIYLREALRELPRSSYGVNADSLADAITRATREAVESSIKY